jgi:hypothetical protein
MPKIQKKWWIKYICTYLDSIYLLLCAYGNFLCRFLKGGLIDFFLIYNSLIFQFKHTQSSRRLWIRSSSIQLRRRGDHWSWGRGRRLLKTDDCFAQQEDSFSSITIQLTTMAGGNSFQFWASKQFVVDSFACLLLLLFSSAAARARLLAGGSFSTIHNGRQ